MFVSEIQIAEPVGAGEFVSSLPDVILRQTAVQTQEIIDILRLLEGEPFPDGIAPAVIFGACHIQRPGGDQSQELMLVKGQRRLIVYVFEEVAAEPVREIAGDETDRLAVAMAPHGSTNNHARRKHL